MSEKIGTVAAAKIAEMSITNLYYLISKDRGPAFEVISKYRIYDKDEVKKWADEYWDGRRAKNGQNTGV